VKFLTDPFYHVAIYWRSRIALVHGQHFDPLDAHGPTAGA